MFSVDRESSTIYKCSCCMYIYVCAYHGCFTSLLPVSSCLFQFGQSFVCVKEIACYMMYIVLLVIAHTICQINGSQQWGQNHILVLV
jgi:hypothetical protein